MRAVHAGDGYAYLLNSVASHDDETKPATRLHDYYDMTGTPPGRWFGKGIIGLGETSLIDRGIVEEFQMAALYGEGLHPDAEKRIQNGESVDETQLGRKYPNFTKGVPVLEAIKDAENAHKKAHGRLLTVEERNAIGLEVARPFYEQVHHVMDASARNVLAWLNEEKNKVRSPVSGMDLTFSPAKSVSIAWALADDETRRKIQEVHERSVRDALSYIEDNLLYTRTGSKSQVQVKAKGMLAATFVHYDTRGGDPDLHTHCLIANKVQAAETAGLSLEDAEKWRALDTRFLFKNSAKIGQLYNRMMTQRLSEELGFSFRQRLSEEGKQPTWEIAGISDQAIDRFSGRRLNARPVYEQYAAQYVKTHGHQPSSRARYKLWQQAVLDTRDAKKPAQSLRDHRASWAQQIDASTLIESIHASHDQRAYFPNPGTQDYHESIAQLAHHAVEDTRSRRAEFAPRHLETSLTMRLNQWRFSDENAEKKIHNDALRYAVDNLLLVATDLPTDELPAALVRADGLAVDRDIESIQLISRATILEEHNVLSALEELTAYLVPGAEVDDALRNHAEEKGFELNHGQQLLVRHLTESGKQITAGVGPAGTGKTASMAVVADVWKRQGHSVIGLAPSAVAAQNLAQDIDSESFTLASLTYRWRGIVGDSPRDPNLLGIDIHPGDMLLIDEAGMATTADLAAIAEIAQETGAIVRMVGDPYQLDAVETGGLFRTIVKRDDSIELDQVMRMGSDEEQAGAGLAIRQGDASGLDLYSRRGWIHGGSRAEMVSSAAKDHLRDAAEGLTSILLASTRDDVNTANSIIQDARREAGLINATGPHIGLGTGHFAFVGDVILARKNETINGQRVLNGQRFSIVGIDEDGTVLARSEERNQLVSLPSAYVHDHVQLGYAATIHRAQGLTVDVTRCVVGAETDRRGLYVGLTRGKKQNHTYVSTDTSIDFEAEDAHWHMSGDEDAADPRKILEHIVTHDAGQISATDARAQLRAQARSPQRFRELYAVASDLLTTDWRHNEVEPAIRGWLDTLQVSDVERIDENKAVERIATAAVALARHGIDYRELMHMATSDLEGSRDVGAVIDHRLRQYLPDTAVDVPSLPPRASGMDAELYSWAEQTREKLVPTQRELRQLDRPLPDAGVVQGRDLRCVDLRGKDLSNLRFVDCDLSGAALDNAEMHRTVFKDSRLVNATFTGVRVGVGDGFTKLTRFSQCDASGADFTGAHLERSKFTATNMTGACFAEANIITADFTNVDLTDATFTGAKVANFVTVSDSALPMDAPEHLHEAQSESTPEQIRGASEQDGAAELEREASERADLSPDL